MSEKDPLEALRQAARLQETEIIPSAELKRRLLERAATTQPQRRLRGRHLAAATVVAALVASGSAAAWVLLSGQAPEVAPICRTEASLDSDVFEVGFTQDPVEACASLWRDGTLPEPDRPMPSGQPIPPLTACIGPTGAIEVLPASTEICERLGLEPAAPSGSAAADVDRVTELNRRIMEEINAAECREAAYVQDAVRELLGDLELKDWAVAKQPDQDLTTCAKAAANSRMKTIWISNTK